MSEYTSPEISVSDLRVKIADVVNATAVDGQITYITNRGRRIAAIVPVRDGDEAVRRREQTE
jgi:prevent-host-death family protein